jgi:hypothetical protein
MIDDRSATVADVICRCFLPGIYTGNIEITDAFDKLGLGRPSRSKFEQRSRALSPER